MKTLLAMLIACAILVPAANAATVPVFNNLMVATTSASPIATAGPFYGSFWSASDASVLADISLRFIRVGTNTDVLSIQLFHDSGGNTPGALQASLASIAVNSIATTYTNYQFGTSGYVGEIAFLPGLNLNLTANTRYWIGVISSGTTSTSEKWAISSTSAGTLGVVGEYRTNKSGTVQNFVGGSPFQMRVDVSPVPEPGTILLSVFGLGTLVFLRRRSA